MQDSFDVVVVGAGAAGIAALRRLRSAGLSAVALEARDRIGGRAWTVAGPGGLALDHGCEWLHSADVNPLVEPITRAGFTIDRTPPAWGRQSGDQDFPLADQRAFRASHAAFEQRLEAAAEGRDRAAAELLEPGGRWNVLIDAISSWYNGVELDQVSVIDFAAYEDSGVNWRVREGYGAAIASFAPIDAIVTDCPVTLIHRDGPALRLETPQGAVTARAAVVAVPTPILADGALRFSPDLPEKTAAAAGLPLGLANKVFLGLADPDALPREGHLFGRPDRTETGSYHLRPFGLPYIEAFIGGRVARGLEAEGAGALTAFAVEELTGLMGADFRAQLAPLGEAVWGRDPWARGSYSHALPGCAGARAALAEPVDARLFFAGEATHPHAFSTAHGAWQSGLRAAEEAVAALGRG